MSKDIDLSGLPSVEHFARGHRAGGPRAASIHELCQWRVDAYRRALAKLSEAVRELEQARDGGWHEWARAEEEGGCCPACHVTDEAAHERGCYVGEVEAERDALQAKLDDDALVDRVVRATCHSEGHDPRWCSHCESMDIGIEAYRAELRKEMADE